MKIEKRESIALRSRYDRDTIASPRAWSMRKIAACSVIANAILVFEIETRSFRFVVERLYSHSLLNTNADLSCLLLLQPSTAFHERFVKECANARWIPLGHEVMRSWSLCFQNWIIIDMWKMYHRAAFASLSLFLSLSGLFRNKKVISGRVVCNVSLVLNKRK